MKKVPRSDPGRTEAGRDALLSWPGTLRLIALRLAERTPAVVIIWLSIRH